MHRTLGALIPVIGVLMAMPIHAGNLKSEGNPGPGAAAAGRTSTGRELPRGADLILLHGKVWTGEPDAGPKVVRGSGSCQRACSCRGQRPGNRCLPGPEHGVGGSQGSVSCAGLEPIATCTSSAAVFSLLAVDLKDARSEEEFVRRIAEKARALKAGSGCKAAIGTRRPGPSAQIPTR